MLAGSVACMPPCGALYRGWMRGAGEFFVDDERLGLDSGDLGGDFALGSLSREIRLHRVSMFRARVDVRTPVLQPVARRSSHAVVLGS